MARDQEYGRKSANVPTGDYRSYKRIIEERRRSIEDEDYAGGARAHEADALSDDMDRAAAEAYAQSTAEEDAELHGALEVDAGEAEEGAEDEESMPAPRRRARAYRADQPSGERRRAADEARDEDEAEPDERDQGAEERPRRANPRSGQARRPARKPPRRPQRPAPRRAAQDDWVEEDEADSVERVRYSEQASRAPRRDESSHEVDDLEDYEPADAAYNDGVYEPFEFEDELDADEDIEDNASEWADGIKRVFERGRQSLHALGVKARKSGKKHSHKARRKPAPRPDAQAASPEEPPRQLDIQPLAEQAAGDAQERREGVDPAEYESVSQELEAIEEPRPVSRRERRLSQQRAEEARAQDDFPQVNIVSRKAMRAQQDAQAEAAAQAQPEEPQIDNYAPVSYAQGQYVPDESPLPEAQAEPAPQPTVNADQPDEEVIMFGIQGRQHIMQPQVEPAVEPQAEQTASIELSWDAQPAAVDMGAADETAQPEAEDAEAPGEPERRLGRRERKAARKASRKQGRRRDYDLPDDDDEEEAAQAQSTETSRYKRAGAPGAFNYAGMGGIDDDDEPEDDEYRAQFGGRVYDANAIHSDPQYGFGEDGEDADEDEAEEPEDARGRGGCLKAFTALLVILLVIFGSIWALDYFNVLNVRRIASDIISLPALDPLRGSLLPEATQTPAPSQQPVQSAQPGATMQPQSGAESETVATPMPGVTLVPTIQPADSSQSGGLLGSALAQQSNTAQTAAASNDAAAGLTTLIEQPSASGRGEMTREQMVRAYSLVSTDPANEEFGLEYGVYVDYERADGYTRPEQMTFGLGEDYTDLEGVITFRGNNFRENASYGTAALAEKDFEIIWKNRIGSIDSGYAVWSGVGWNGQPVMVRWSDEMRQMMNIKEEYKSDSELVEVIYGALDGNIYFLDARTGEYTREPIELGYPIKGSVSIDPRGYPLLYVGQGISKANGHTGSIGWRVYNLLNQEHMYLLNGHDELRFRTHGSFDGVCLLDAETDTIVEGGENGIFYTIKLNTLFDPAAPSISIDPVVTLYRYESAISDELGFENSVAAYGQYAYLVDNSGLMSCFDLNTMTPVWLFDVGDDTDASIALEPQSDGLIALYTANEVDKQGSSGLSTIRKLDALSGEELWNFSVECRSDGDNGGGAFASPALGKNQLSDLIYFNICRTSGGGTLYAFDKQSGAIVWQQSTQRYSWSSPVIVYNEAGEGVVVLGNSGGMIRMYDGRTGEQLSEIEIDGNMEGSPAVFDDMLVIGTRDCNIYGIRIL